jgi:acyl carrier protein phosphodiesterase
MKQMITEYINSSILVKNRIDELCCQKKELEDIGRDDIVAGLDLDRRIRVLRAEYAQVRETAEYLSSCVRRIEQRVET